MNKSRRFLTIAIIAILSIQFAFAQKGKVRGTIFDGANGESFPFANVLVKGTLIGASSDLDGKYTLSLEPGTYDLIYSFVGYTDATVTGVKVSEGETTLVDITLQESKKMLEAVLITAEQQKNTESSMLKVQKESANVLDGITAQSFAKMGDSNVAGAIKRVSGVSIQGGKYVYVRGLGDRYTKSILNGVDIPGLDPDRNTVQMDIFPTSIIENIQIFKSSSADLPADFTGGVVNIVTKSFPEQKTLTVSGSLGFNPAMHFNNDYITYQGGKTDFLGFDDGNRELPVANDRIIEPSIYIRDGEEARSIASSFNSTLAVMKQKSAANYGFGISLGNQVDGDKYTWGYTASLSYKNKTSYFNDYENNVFERSDDKSTYNLEGQRVQNGDVGVNNVLISGMAGLALKTDNSKYIINLLRLQNGESKAGLLNISSFGESGSFRGYKHNLEYSERSITNLLLSGKNSLKQGDLELEWKLSPTKSVIEDKDIRITPFEVIDGGAAAISPSEIGSPARIWRNLDEVNFAALAGVIKKGEFRGRPSKLKFGAGNTYKQRDYQILNYTLRIQDQSQFDISGDPNQLLSEELLYNSDKRAGSFIFGTYQESNTYDATQNTTTLYTSAELGLSDNLKTIIGVRAEDYNHWYTGQNQTANSNPNAPNARVFDNEKVLSSLDIFPSIGLILSTTDQTNLRLNYSRTTARPSFKEKSAAQIFDPLSQRTFIGNLDVVSTYINNLDFRWEAYQSKGRMISASLFFKDFSNPIEIVSFSESAPDNLTPRNVSSAVVYGVEFEARQNLSFLSPRLENISLTFNTSIAESAVKMDKSLDGEYESRLKNVRDGETIKDTRQLQGQAPYVVNGGINYVMNKIGLDLGMYYNVQGEKLAVVGIASVPDVYEQPFHNLNFNVSKSLGVNSKSQITFGIQNILKDQRELFYQSYKADAEVFRKFSPGRVFNLKFKYSFF